MFLSPAELGALLDHVRTAATTAAPQQRSAARTDEVIIEVLVHSGLRTSEFCALRVADARIGRSQSELFVRGKRGDDRTVCIPKRVAALVQQYVKSIRPKDIASSSRRNTEQATLILNERGKPYERTGMYRRVKRILTDTGLGERASVQLLRHTYGYLAYKQTGGNLLFVQRQMGHAHPMVTSVYASLIDESYALLAEKLDAGSAGRTKIKRKRAAVSTH